MNILNTYDISFNFEHKNKVIEYEFSMNKNPKIIMITGANGFLSSHLLENLSKLNEVEKIFCLVRDESSMNYQHEKIQVVKYAGIESFSLDNHELDEYLNITDSFIHCAAAVNNIKNFNSLYCSNVEFSQSILRKIKSMKLSLAFHLVSTLSVYASSFNNIEQYNSDQFNIQSPENLLIPTNKNYNIVGGYAQTKWLSEHVFSKTNAHIIRLGLLTPSYKEPQFKNNEFITQIIKLLIKTKSIPYENRKQFEKIAKKTLVDITPVDLASQFISDLISSRYQFAYKTEVTPFISHIANHESLSLFQMKNIIEETKKFRFVYNNEHEWKILLDKLNISNLEQKLLKHTFFRNELIKQNLKYFNIDLFQSSLYDWGAYSKAKEMPTSSSIFYKYLKEFNV